MKLMERKYFFIWTMDKEKAYLEDMARKGYILTDVKLFKYYFEKTEPMDYIYEFDFQFLIHMSEEDYLSFFEEWELVKRFGLWYYFRRIRTNTVRDSIYSDNESKGNMYRGIFLFLVLTGLPLYIQFPVMLSQFMEINSSVADFYRYFKYFIFILTPIHFMVSCSILTTYLGYRKRIKE